MARRKPKKNARRPRDASGRFLSASEVAQRSSALRGEIIAQTITRRRGDQKTSRTVYRDEDGRFVKASIAESQKGGPTPILKSKGEFHKVSPVKTVASKAPPGTAKVIAMDLYGQSAPSLIEDNAIRGRKTFVRWRGKVSRVPAERAGKVSDIFRLIEADYVSRTIKLMDSPQLKFGLIETDEGDVLDMDAIETMDEELADELEGDEDLEEAVHGFNRRLTKELDKLTRHARKRNDQDKAKPVERGRSRSAPRRKGRGGKGRSHRVHRSRGKRRT